MDPKDLNGWIGVAEHLVAIVTFVVAGFWAWSRLVVERGLLPASQMDLGLRSIGSTSNATIIEIAVWIQNKGSSALVVSDLRLKLRYASDRDEIRVVSEDGATFGRLNFPFAHVLDGVGGTERTAPTTHKSRPDKHAATLKRGEFQVVPYDTFVQPGINQLYTFVTALPKEASYVLVRSSFYYEMKPSNAQLIILRISRRVGLLQYSLNHIRKPHTIERSFPVDADTESTNPA